MSLFFVENDGCDGGDMTSAYEYVRRNPGVDTEASYPYEEKASTCRFDPANVGANCIDWMEIQEGDEIALEQAVASIGPVAAGIDGAQRTFMFYKSGFYFDQNCETEVNHAVVIVGYGKTESGEEYWLCKNSWDTDWGEEGYVRMARNKDNHCGITSLASYPIV
jgi:C1A family cysteine protease